MLRAMRWLAVSLGTFVLLGAMVAVGAGIAQAASAADSGAVLAGGGHVVASDADRRAFDLLAVPALRASDATHGSRARDGRRVVAPRAWRLTGDLNQGGKRWADSGVGGKRWT